MYAFNKKYVCPTYNKCRYVVRQFGEFCCINKALLIMYLVHLIYIYKLLIVREQLCSTASLIPQDS